MALLCLQQALLAQNIKDDFSIIEKNYQKNDRSVVELAINMFENYTSTKIYYAQSGTIKRLGNDYVYFFDNTETIATANYVLAVDKDDKTVVYMPKKTATKETGYKVNYDSIILFCKKYQFNKVDADKANYDFVMKDFYPEYERIIVEFNTKKHIVTKIVFFCREDDISIDDGDEKISKSRVELVYRDITSASDLNENDFSYQKYLTKASNKFVLKPEYKNYHLTVLSLPK